MVLDYNILYKSQKPHPRMPETRDSAILFFETFLGHFSQGQREEVEDKLVEAAKESRDVSTLRAIVSLEQAKLEVMERAGLGSGEIWLTAKDLVRLGGYAYPTVAAKLAERGLESRPGQRRPRQRGKPAAEYRINLGNCAWFDKERGIKDQILSASKLPQRIEKIRSLQTLIKELEPQASESLPSQTPPEEGRWMTAAEIKYLGSPLNLTYIGVILGKNPGEFKTRRRGKRAYEGLITPGNCSRFKIPKQTLEAKLSQPHLQASEELEVSPLAPCSEIRKVRFPNGASYELDSAQLYGPKFLQQIMANLGSQFKGEDLDALFRKLAVSQSPTQRGVPGNTLFGLLQQASQAAVLGDDFYTYLAAEAGVNTSEVRGLFKSELAARAKYLAGNLFPYVPRPGLETLIEDVREAIHGVRRFPDEVLVAEQPRARTADEIFQEGRREAQKAVEAARKTAEAAKQVSAEAARARESSKVDIEAGGLKCTIYPEDVYPRAQVETMIQQIHPLYFGSRAQAFVSSLDSRGNVSGTDLIRFLETFKGRGILDPSSTSARQKLERELGIGYEQILEDAELNRFVQRPSQDPNSPYILRADLSKMRELIAARSPAHKISTPPEPARRTASPLEEAAEPQVDPERVLISELSRRLGQHAPKNRLFEKLRDTGVFQLDSPDSAKRTAAAFAESMRGWKYFDFNKFRESIGVADWREFTDGYLSQLVEAGMVKDLVGELGVYENPRKLTVYVLKKETTPKELFEFFGLPVPATWHDLTTRHYHGS